MTNKLFLATATAVVATAAMVAPVQAEGAYVGFNDVPSNHQFAPYINYLADKGIVKQATFFNPANKVTRTQVALMLGRTVPNSDVAVTKANAKSYLETKFKDSNLMPTDADDIFSLAKAVEAGFFKGKPDKTFGFRDDISRQQMGNVLSRGLASKETKAEANGKVLVSDYDSIVLETGFQIGSDDNIQLLGKYGLTNQTDFRGKETLTRGQMSKLLAIYLQVSEVDKEVEVPADPTPPIPEPIAPVIQSVSDKANTFIVYAENGKISPDNIYLSIESNDDFEDKIVKKSIGEDMVEISILDVDHDLALTTDVAVDGKNIGDFELVDVVKPTVESFYQDANYIQITFSEPVVISTEEKDIVTIVGNGGVAEEGTESIQYKLFTRKDVETTFNLELKDLPKGENFLFNVDVTDKAGNVIESENGYIELPSLTTAAQ